MLFGIFTIFGKSQKKKLKSPKYPPDSLNTELYLELKIFRVEFVQQIILILYILEKNINIKKYILYSMFTLRANTLPLVLFIKKDF